MILQKISTPSKQYHNIPKENIGAKIRNNLVEVKTILQILEKKHAKNTDLQKLILSSLQSISDTVFLSFEINQELTQKQ